MARRRTIKTLTEDELAPLLDATVGMHEILLPMMMKLRVDCEHYRAVRDLHMAMVETRRRLTGEHLPSWATPKTVCLTG